MAICSQNCWPKQYPPILPESIRLSTSGSASGGARGVWLTFNGLSRDSSHHEEGWKDKDCSAVKSLGAFSEGLNSSFSTYMAASQMPLTLVPGDLVPSCGHHRHQAHTWCTYTQTHKIINSKEKKASLILQQTAWACTRKVTRFKESGWPEAHRLSQSLG